MVVSFEFAIHTLQFSLESASGGVFMDAEVQREINDLKAAMRGVAGALRQLQLYAGVGTEAA